MNVAKSLKAEFHKRGISSEPSPGQGLGLAMCILQVCGIIPFVGIIAGVATLVLWIMYWVKIAGFSAQIALVPEQSSARQLRIITPQEQMIACPLCNTQLPISRIAIGRNTCPTCGGFFDAEG